MFGIEAEHVAVDSLSRNRIPDLRYLGKETDLVSGYFKVDCGFHMTRDLLKR
jgi:hypothetical protein